MMIDELDLGFGENEDRDRDRHRRRHANSSTRGKKKKKKKGGRSFLALFMALLLLGGLAGGAWFGYSKVKGFFSTPDYDSADFAAKVGCVNAEDPNCTVVEIKQGALGNDIAKALKAKDIIQSEQAFIDASTENSKARNIQPGFYLVRLKLSGTDAVSMLLETKNRIVKGITIPEGLSTFKIFKLLAEKTEIPEADFKEAAKDPLALGVPDWWFTLADGKKAKPALEGFLFPDTYEFPPNATAESILKTMVSHFVKVTGDIKFVDTVQNERGGVTPYQALIVASLAQAEAGNPDDLGKVARVAYNRVFSGKFDCNCLQFDVTVNYSFELAGKPPKTSSQMTVKDMDDPKNPYNRLIKGLVPTPINNPGKLALTGSMTPPAGKWLYFVAIDKEGHSAFADNYAGHCTNIRKAHDAGVLSSAEC